MLAMRLRNTKESYAGWLCPCITPGIQKPALQTDALQDGSAANCIFTETASGVQRARPELTVALAIQVGDTFAVAARLPGALMRQLIETVDLQARGIALRSLTEQIDS